MQPGSTALPVCSYPRNKVEQEGRWDLTNPCALFPEPCSLHSYKDILRIMLEPEISVQAFSQLRQQPDAPILLDVREPWEHQTASLPNSLLMPMGEVASRAHTELDPDAPIVVLCHHGARSLSVTMWLRNQGFEQVQSLAGGIDAWSRTIDPTIPRY
jgi:rhodanese-related sulfurtransferase